MCAVIFIHINRLRHWLVQIRHYMKLGRVFSKEMKAMPLKRSYLLQNGTTLGTSWTLVGSISLHLFV